jgi:hypothetical protein
MLFYGSATKLSQNDYVNGGNMLGVQDIDIETVTIVETGGLSGFTSDKRPRILFEAHLFSRFTNHKYDASHPDISSFSWNRKLYSNSSIKEYDRLQKAMT